MTTDHRPPPPGPGPADPATRRLVIDNSEGRFTPSEPTPAVATFDARLVHALVEAGRLDGVTLPEASLAPPTEAAEPTMGYATEPTSAAEWVPSGRITTVHITFDPAVLTKTLRDALGVDVEVPL